MGEWVGGRVGGNSLSRKSVHQMVGAEKGVRVSVGGWGGGG